MRSSPYSASDDLTLPLGRYNTSAQSCWMEANLAPIGELKVPT